MTADFMTLVNSQNDLQAVKPKLHILEEPRQFEVLKFEGEEGSQRLTRFGKMLSSRSEFMIMQDVQFSWPYSVRLELKIRKSL